MKVEAYICDCCQLIKDSSESIGISLQQDAFEILKSYPSIFIPSKAEVHYCLTCYNMKVISVAERETNRRNDERAYKLKIIELTYMLKTQCVLNYNNKISKKSCNRQKKM